MMAAILFGTAAGSKGFQHSQVIQVNYSSVTVCNPPTNALYPGFPQALAASRFTGCEIGVGIAPPANSVPTYILVPAYAGLSVFGFTAWNSTAQGYPTFDGNAIVTACGAAGTKAGCSGGANSITSYYSTAIGVWEKQMGIANGIYGYPEGVMPNSAHDLMLPTAAHNGQYSYLVRVGVFDPNIFPNITTGRCTQVVPSNLTNATGNCLTSRGALQRALMTEDTAVLAANGNNILYTAKNIQPFQASITIANVTVMSEPYNGSSRNVTYVGYYTTTNVNASNLNAVRFISNITQITQSNTVRTTSSVPATTITTTVPAIGKGGMASNQESYLGFGIVVMGGLILAFLCFLTRRVKR